MSLTEQEQFTEEYIDAAGNGDLAKVKECINKGVDVEAQDSNSYRAIHHASYCGHIHIVKHLIEQCHVDVNTKIDSGHSALHLASRQGHLNIVRYFIQDCRVNVTITITNRGSIALHLASEYGHLDIVRYFIQDCHVDVNAKKDDGFTALHLASQKGYLHIVQFFVRDCHVDVRTTKTNRGSTALHVASQHGHLDISRYFIQDCHLDVATINNNGLTALHSASIGGHWNTVRYLIQDCHVNVNTKDNDGWTALHLASQFGHLDIVRYFIQDCHVDVIATEANDGWTALHVASQFAHLNIVQYFIQDCHVDGNAKNINGHTALYIASEFGHVEVVRYLVQACHVDPSSKNNNGWTALHIASQNGFLDVVQCFVEECNVDITVTTNLGRTAYQVSRDQGKINVADYLSKSLGNVKQNMTTESTTHQSSKNEVNQRQPNPNFSSYQQVHPNEQEQLTEEFIDAAGNGDQDKVNECIDKGVDVEAQKSNSYRAIHAASRYGRFKIVKYLIEQCHVDVNTRIDSGHSALHLASEKGHLDIVRYLMQNCHGDVISTKRCDGWTALHSACATGQLSIVRFFIQDCHINATTTKDNEGWTALHTASQYGQLDIVRYLIQVCHINATTTIDNDGWNALHAASHYGNLDIVRYFVQDCQVNASTKNYKGSTAFHFASFAGHLDIVRYFIQGRLCNAAVINNDGGTALHLASQEGHLEIVQYLVQTCDADIAVTTNLGKTAYQIACDHGKLSVADYLSRARDSVEQNTATETATHQIIMNANSESVLEIVNDRKSIEILFNDPTADPIVLSLKYLKLCTDNFTSKVLGKGAFGTVYFGCDKELGVQIAVKRITLPILDQEGLDEMTLSFKREIAVLKRFRHPNIVVMYGYNIQMNESSQFLVYEYLSNGSLAGFLEDEKGRTRLLSNVRLSIMFQLARSVHFLHTGGCENLVVFHRDIKSRNVCLTQNYTAKLIDCGLAKFVAEKTGDDFQGSVSPSMLKSSGAAVFGTAGYICPVYARGQSQYTSACDVFSIGVVFAELLVGSLQGGQSSRSGKKLGDFFGRYVKDDDEEPVKDGWKIMKQDADMLAQWNDGILEKLCRLTVHCMAASPKRRISTLELVQKLIEISRLDYVFRGDLGHASVAPDFSVHSHSEGTYACSTLCKVGTTDCAKNLYNHCVSCNRSVGNNIVCVDGHQTCVHCVEEEIHAHMGQTGDGFYCQCGSRIHDDELYGKISISTFSNYIHARSLRRALNEQFAEIKSQLKTISKMTEQNHGIVTTMLKGIDSNVQRVLGGLAYIATNSVKECPTIVWLVPSERIQGRSVKSLKQFAMGRSVKGLEQFAVNLTHKTFDLYFVCQHSFEIVDTNMTIKISRPWLVQVAPALYLSTFVLKVALTVGGLVPFPFPFPNMSRYEQLSMQQDFLSDFLDDETMASLQEFVFAYTNRSDISYSQSSKLQALTGAAYEGIVARAMKMKRYMHWRQHMDPVANKQGSIIWVKKEHSDKYLTSSTALPQNQ